MSDSFRESNDSLPCWLLAQTWIERLVFTRLGYRTLKSEFFIEGDIVSR